MMATRARAFRSLLGVSVEQLAARVVKDSGEQLLRNAEALAQSRVGTISGVYHSSFRLQETEFTAQVVNDAPYAGIVEGGSVPHQILPRNASLLQIEPPITSYIDGRQIKALPRVNHPGTTAKWVMRDALRQTIREKFGQS